jgi:hypothetical protein
VKVQPEEVEELAPALHLSGAKFLLGVFCSLGLAGALLTRAYLGTFTRLMADDYCGAIDLARMGFWGSLTDWYLTWDGRFAANIVTLSAEAAGPGIVPVLPSILLVIWLLALTFTIHELLSSLKWANKLGKSFLLAELVLYATMETAPNSIQSFQWETGLIVYSVPLVLLTVYVGLVFRILKYAPKRKISAYLLLSGVITFIAGGFSETYVAMQAGSLALAVLILPLIVKEFPRRIIFPGLTGSLFALVTVATAPGNAVRQYFNPFERHWSQQISSAVLYSFYFVYRFVREHPISFLLCLVIPAAIAFIAYDVIPPRKSEISPRRVSKLLLCNVAVFLIVLSSVAPGYYGFGSRPPDRAMVTAQFVLVCATIGWGLLMGSRIKLLVAERYGSKAFAAAVVLLLLLLMLVGPLASMRIDLANAGGFRKYAQQWDQQDKVIRESRSIGTRDLVLLPLPVSGFGGLEVPGPNPKVGFNTCIAKYYGLDSLAYRLEP